MALHWLGIAGSLHEFCLLANTKKCQKAAVWWDTYNMLIAGKDLDDKQILLKKNSLGRKINLKMYM